MKKHKKKISMKKAYEQMEKEWEEEGKSQNHKTDKIDFRGLTLVLKPNPLLVAGVGHYGKSMLFNLQKLGFKGATAYFHGKKTVTSKMPGWGLLFLFVDPCEKSYLITKKICRAARKSKNTVCFFIPNSPELKNSDIKKFRRYADTFILLKKNNGPEFVKAFTEMIEQPSLIGLDFNDIFSFIKQGKTAGIFIAEARGKNKAKAAAAEISSEIGKTNDIDVFLIIRGDRKISLDDIAEAGETVTDRIGENSNIVWTANADKNYRNKIKVYCIVFYDEQQSKENLKTQKR